jgi:hypothetical protein
MRTKKPQPIKPQPVHEMADCPKCHGSGKSDEYRCYGIVLKKGIDLKKDWIEETFVFYEQCRAEGKHEVEFEDGTKYFCCGKHLNVLTRLIEKETNDEFTLINYKNYIYQAREVENHDDEL